MIVFFTILRVKHGEQCMRGQLTVRKAQLQFEQGTTGVLQEGKGFLYKIE